MGKGRERVTARVKPQTVKVSKKNVEQVTNEQGRERTPDNCCSPDKDCGSRIYMDHTFDD